MPDISNAGSHKYWDDYKDKSIYRNLSFMESVENSFTFDGDEKIEEMLSKLGEALEGIEGISLEKEDELIKLLAYLKAARMLRIMQCLDLANPGSASKLLIKAEKTTTSPQDVHGLFLSRNMAFEHIRLLSRIFAKKRLDLVQKATEEA